MSTMSSTYRSSHAVSAPRRSTKREVSEPVVTKPSNRRCSKMLVPCSRSLSKTVERFVEETHVIQMCAVLKAGRLLGVDSLLELSVHERIANIKLMHRPLIRCC